MVYTVGIIGTGFGSKVHLPGFQAHKDFEVKIIAGRNSKKTSEIATNAGIDATTNWIDIIQSDVDLIAVTTPPFLHFNMGLETLNAGKHLLLEKPTTTNATEAKSLASLALNNGLIGMMSHEFRWTPERKFLSHLISSDKIGDLKEIHYHNFYEFGASKDHPLFGWLWDNRFEGGMLGAIGSHLIDQLRSTVVKEFTSLSGYITTRTPNRKNSEDSYSKVTADDGFGMNFEMENNVVGNLTVSTTISPAPKSQFVLSGEKGVLKLEDNQIYFGKEGQEFSKLEIPENFQIDTTLAEKDRRLPPFMKLLDQLSNSIKTGKTGSPSLTDGWKNQQVVDAVRDSHRTGQRIRIFN